MDDITKKITKAKVSVILEQPFFATLLARKSFVADRGVNGLVTNGKQVRYNPEDIEAMPHEDLKTAICAEAMHTAMLHHTRREGRDAGQWNDACDYAIHPILLKAGFKLPEGALYDSQYEDMTAEDIYKRIGKKPDNKPGDQPSPQGGGDSGDQPQPGNQYGGVEDAPKDDGKSIAEQEADAKSELAQALQIAKQQGKLPGNLELIMQVLEAKVNWKEALARFLSEPAQNDYTFSRPNKRYLHSGFILPSLYNLEVGEIVLMADTSASMDEDALNRVGTEIHDVASSFSAHMTILYVDTHLQGVQFVEPDEELRLEPKGGGGTDFRPGFQYLDEEGIIPKSVVYFTDGECDDFPEVEPDYPVLWAITGGYKFEPPFGEVIKID